VIVTDGVKDAAGDSIGQGRSSSVLGQLRKEVMQALENVRGPSGERLKIVGASIFTTMSVTSDLEKIQDHIQASSPTPVDFNVTADGQRAVFPVNTLTSLTWNTQQTVGPVLAPIPLPNLLGLQALDRRSAGAGTDRHVLRDGRRGDDRPGRCECDLRNADRSAAARDAEFHSVRSSSSTKTRAARPPWSLYRSRPLFRGSLHSRLVRTIFRSRPRNL
jgi:hypothetical protein